MEREGSRRRQRRRQGGAPGLQRAPSPRQWGRSGAHQGSPQAGKTCAEAEGEGAAGALLLPGERSGCYTPAIAAALCSAWLPGRCVTHAAPWSLPPAVWGRPAGEQGLLVILESRGMLSSRWAPSSEAAPLRLLPADLPPVIGRLLRQAQSAQVSTARHAEKTSFNIAVYTSCALDAWQALCSPADRTSAASSGGNASLALGRALLVEMATVQIRAPCASLLNLPARQRHSIAPPA